MYSICHKISEEFRFVKVLSQMNSISLDESRNETFIAHLVRKVGLVNDFRPLYGFNYKTGSEESYMHKKRNYGMFQLPKQVGCMLSTISQSSIPMNNFVEIGSFYGWTGLFFSVFLRRLNTLLVQSNPYLSASFDIVDMRTRCIGSLMNYYRHDFYINKFSPKLKQFRPILSEDYLNASKWYRKHLQKTFSTSAKTLDLCFIDGEHGYPSVRADVQFFAPICKFLLFHDIVDADSHGVRYMWSQIKSQTQDMKECTQQAGTNRKNFGLGLVSSQNINLSLLK